MKFEWSEDKNSVLRTQRGITFEQVVLAVESGQIVSVEQHPDQAKFPDQWMLVVDIEGYLCRVPFVWQDQDSVFLKTIYPSRKEMKKWNRK